LRHFGQLASIFAIYETDRYSKLFRGSGKPAWVNALLQGDANGARYSDCAVRAFFRRNSPEKRKLTRPFERRPMQFGRNAVVDRCNRIGVRHWLALVLGNGNPRHFVGCLRLIRPTAKRKILGPHQVDLNRRNGSTPVSMEKPLSVLLGVGE
jgi:hypothetical protein